MKRLVLTLGLAIAAGTALPVSVSTPASAEEVAGRPALPTTSVADLVKMRESWGTAPSTAK